MTSEVGTSSSIPIGSKMINNNKKERNEPKFCQRNGDTWKI